MNETVEQLIDELRPLAEKIGEGAEYLWEVSYRQALISGITDLIVASILLLVMVVSFFYARHVTNTSSWPDDAPPPYFVWTAPNIFVGIFFMSFLVSGLKRILNPGYYALEELFKALPL